MWGLFEGGSTEQSDCTSDFGSGGGAGVRELRGTCGLTSLTATRSVKGQIILLFKISQNLQTNVQL